MGRNIQYKSEFLIVPENMEVLEKEKRRTAQNVECISKGHGRPLNELPIAKSVTIWSKT